MPPKQKLFDPSPADTETLYRDFPITSVCRADLVNQGYDVLEVLKINDSDMARLAEHMAESYTGNDTFWQDLDTFTDDVLKLKKVTD